MKNWRVTNSKALLIVLVLMWSDGKLGLINAQNERPGESREPEVMSLAAKELLQSVGVKEFTGQKLSEVFNDLIGRRDRRLVPYLEERFAETESHSTRSHAAARLVYLGAEDPMYWEYVYRGAKEAVSSEMPNPSDPNRSVGAWMDEELWEFRSWREERGLTLAEAIELQRRYYASLEDLGATVDPRAVELAIEGLEARNAMIVVSSVMSLARLQDDRAIVPIITALEKQPSGVAEVGARWLLHFDDSRAQDAAARFIGAEREYDALRAHVAEHGMKSIYGY